MNDEEKQKKLNDLKDEIDDLFQVLKFYNENFSKIHENRKSGDIYFKHISERYKKILEKKEKTIKEVKDD
jgi:hypothetical protein